MSRRSAISRRLSAVGRRRFRSRCFKSFNRKSQIADRKSPIDRPSAKIVNLQSAISNLQSAAVAVLLVAACAGTDPVVTPLELSVDRLRPLDPATEGTYEAWVISTDGEILSAGRFGVAAEPATVTLGSPLPDPAAFMVTVEPPADEDDRPSLHRLLGGPIDGGAATLAVTSYVTITGIPLETNPGTHVLALSGDNGYTPSDAGLWLFNQGGDSLDGSLYLNLTPLTDGWAYEGWIVRDYDTPDAIWISYGKFRPDPFRQVNIRDDTGLGPFSGRADYQRALALQVRVPGDDWVSNPLGLTVPGGLTLPFDLNGDAAGAVASRWTHVITIEPWGPNRDVEPLDETQPFFVMPYRNAVGEDAVDVPRVVEFFGGELPSGTVMVR